MNSAITALLRPVVVRVSVRGAGGTGFFIAPDLVLSCAHVTNGQTGDPVTVYWRGRILRGRLVRQEPPLPPASGPYPYPDISLIEVEGDGGNPCALLGLEPPALESRLHSRGFTTTWSRLPTEEPSTFTYVGPHEVEGGELLKLSAGEAVPGMSGGPLVDLASGTVCGILKSSRDVGTDRGGWGIPIQAVADLFPEAVAANARHHAASRAWADAAARLRPHGSGGLVVDIGSIAETSSSGRPARVSFTVTNFTSARIKVPAITLDQLDSTRLAEPHHFLAEGLPQHFDLKARLTPGKKSHELLELHHVLEPGETEGYWLRITAEEGWRYTLRLRISWWELGSADKQMWTGEPFELPFRIMSIAGLLTSIDEEGSDANGSS